MLKFEEPVFKGSRTMKYLASPEVNHPPPTCEKTPVGFDVSKSHEAPQSHGAIWGEFCNQSCP